MADPPDLEGPIVSTPVKKRVQASLASLFGVTPSPVKSPFAGRPLIDVVEVAESLVAAARQPKTRRAGAGRPKKEESECRAVHKNPVMKTNKLKDGMVRRRWDPNPHQGLRICRMYGALKVKGHTDLEANTALVKVLDRDLKSVKCITRKDVGFWEAKKKENMRVGAFGPNRTGEHKKLHERFDGESAGCRGAGGGRKLDYPAHMKTLKVIVDMELENGNSVEPEELLEHFEWLLRRDAETLEAQERSPEEELRMKQLQDKLKKLETTDNRKGLKKAILKYCRYAYLKPQRQVSISLEEECRRAHQTWRSWDYMLWVAASKDLELLKAYIIDPVAWRQQIDGGDLVLGWSDQVPWWGYLQTMKQLYSGGRCALGRAFRSAIGLIWLSTSLSLDISTTILAAQSSGATPPRRPPSPLPV